MASEAADHALLLGLRKRLSDCLASVLGPGRQVALLGFPLHENVGDSLIWLGTRELLLERDATVVYQSDAFDFGERGLRDLQAEGVIVLQGGGNFGDLWPHHQRHREHVLERFPRRRVVQMPQSIHFDSRTNLERCRRVIAAHEDFVLLVRDRKSLAAARRQFDCEVRLCPDAALALSPSDLPAPDSPPEVDLLALCRQDRESDGRLEGFLETLPAGTTVRRTDWLDATRGWPATLLRTFATLRGVRLGGPLRPFASRRFDEVAAARCRRGVELLHTGRRVATDRLHGHILCLLLGKEHMVADNSYGKIHAFYETWTADSELASWV